MPSTTSNLRIFALVVIASVAGCVGRIESRGYPDHGENVGSAGSGGSGGDGVNGAGAGDGYCRVQALLQNHCGSCHSSSRPTVGSVSLATYDDLMAPSGGDASLRVIDDALARMRSDIDPMPPKPAAPVAQADLAFVEAWLQQGAAADCTPDGEPKPGIYDTPTVCTSDRYWTHGDDESPKMHPGRACIACHSGSSEEEAEEDEGPQFWLAGTVYPTAHEPDECNGIDGSRTGTKIEIVDADGKVLILSVNAAGNFYYEKEAGPLTLPYVAKVLHDGRERAMVTPQRNGDCNSCHTLNGDKQAPARILLP